MNVAKLLYPATTYTFDESNETFTNHYKITQHKIFTAENSAHVIYVFKLLIQTVR